MDPNLHLSLNFDPEAALNYAQSLARPRRVGSGEDKIVAGELADLLARLGYQVERQKFTVSTAPGIIITVEILLSQLLILLIMALEISDPVYLIPATLILLSILIVSGPLNRAVQAGSVLPEPDRELTHWPRICTRLGSRFSSENIIARLTASPAAQNVPHLFLVAHYDSKSQRIPLIVRVSLFALVIPGAFLFAFLALLGIALPAVTLINLWLGGLVIVLSLPLLALDFGNASPGAIDNASGVGTALQLAQSFSAHSIQGIELTILLTGAEELSLLGAQAFLQYHENELRLQAEAGGVHILNIDGTGVAGRLYYAGEKISTLPMASERLPAVLGESGDNLRIRIKRFSLPGALFDHAPFARRGFDALTLLTIGRSSWAVHTGRDAPDILEKAGFDQVGQVISRIIEILAGS